MEQQFFSFTNDNRTKFIRQYFYKGIAKIKSSYNSLFGEGLEKDDEIGFNPNSGYFYLSLFNGVSICSFMGNDVIFVVRDNENQYIFDNYNDAQNYKSTQ
jgi:hypothetical protein